MEPLRKITIIPRGMALGYTKTLTEDKYLPTRSQFKDEVATRLGGRVAEELIFNEITTGAHNDIEIATKIAHKMVADFGMSEVLGPRTFGDKQELVFLGREISEQKDYGDKIADTIDEEVNKIIQEGYSTAKKILTENKQRLIQLAKRLLAQETIEGKELDALLGGTIPRKSARKARVKPTPVPVEPVAEKEPAAKPRKAPAVPRLVPKQTPATPD
jgi:cell division protease FtsH